MSLDNSECENCSGIYFEPANGAFYCQSCGAESRAHGQDFVNEETYHPFIEPSELGEDTDSNDENNRRNDYSDEEDLLQSDNEESIGKVII